MASKFFPMDSFEILSLSKAKDTLFLKKEEFEGIIRYSSTTARNDYGIAMNLAASNLSQNLSEDDGSSAAMKEFLAQKGFVKQYLVYNQWRGRTANSCSFEW